MFSQPYFQPNFSDETTSVAKTTQNILTSLKMINEVIRLIGGNPLGY
jgi:hypothetical protein